MKLTDFDFQLPKELIAQIPAEPRNHSRLLVYDRAKKQLSNDIFYNLDKYLLAKTTLVLNDSKVEKSRLNFSGTEIFILEVINPTTIKALVRPGKKFKINTTQHIPLFQGPSLEALKAEVVDIGDDGVRTLKLNMPIDDKRLDPYRLTPLPPYISQDESLSKSYQTVYADPLGSKAAPTAGLHFIDKQLRELSKKHPIAKLTLHIGLGTFLPVKTPNIYDHKMHFEEFYISSITAKILNQADSITAVGTTSLRALESVSVPFCEKKAETNIFITPGYKFKNVDSLLTNFHLPKSTLLMLVAAFIGSTDETLKIYKYAVDNKYRFYSFGDCMLIV